MKSPRLIIKKNELDLSKYFFFDYDNLPEFFDVIEEIRKIGNKPSYISWLIIHCKYAQKLEILDYYKSLNPSYADVSWLIEHCPFANTPEMNEYLKSIKVKS
jgi:hypothetical protein